MEAATRRDVEAARTDNSSKMRTDPPGGGGALAQEGKTGGTMGGGSCPICYLCGLLGHIAAMSPNKGTRESALGSLKIYLLDKECSHSEWTLDRIAYGPPPGGSLFRS